MSVLSPEIHSALVQLLQGLQSPDNNVRSYAEEQLNNEWVIARPDVLLMGLVEQVQASQDLSVCLAHASSSPSLGCDERSQSSSCAPSPPSYFGEWPRRPGRFQTRKNRKSSFLLCSHPKKELSGRSSWNVYIRKLKRSLGTRLETQWQKSQDNMPIPVNCHLFHCSRCAKTRAWLIFVGPH